MKKYIVSATNMAANRTFVLNNPQYADYEPLSLEEIIMKLRTDDWDEIHVVK